MSNGVFTGTIIVAKDGSLNVELQSLRVRASKRFTPSQLLPLKSWLNTATDDWEVVPPKNPSQRISYCHETGKLRLETGGGIQYYDPNKDEDLARLVRHLKSRAPMPKSEPVQLVLLPSPTAEEMANRTIYANPAPANGYSGQATMRSARSTKSTASKERSRQVLLELKSRMLAARAKVKA